MPFLGAPLRVDRWRGFCWVVCGLALPTLALAADAPLKLSVYATAGGVNRHLNTADGRERAVGALRHLGITKIFLEGRRGDAYVSPDTLRVVRDYFVERGVQVSGGIATVPGASFGVRQNERLGWLNYEAEKTQREALELAPRALAAEYQKRLHRYLSGLVYRDTPQKQIAAESEGFRR